MIRLSLLFLLTALLIPLASSAAEPIRVLIVDGQNNHNWKATTPILKKTLEDTGLFKVDVATAPAPVGKAPPPPKNADDKAAMQKYEADLEKFKLSAAQYKKDMAAFRPKFSDYQAVVSNYNGELWSEETQRDFVKYVEQGGGFVVVHAANNAFPQWPEYNLIIGVGGWGGRNEKSGPYIRLRDGKFTLDTSKGNGGSHGAQHEFVVEIRDKEHPITKGLPEKWLHAKDELYDRLRGPAKNVHVLATAFADPKTGGSGEHEPMLMVIEYGKGRVFHTTLGHADYSMKCVGFAVTFSRGVEWAATGKVTQKVPEDFPKVDKTSSRP
ncbi:MAG: ThuA domain-containing protein [Gemmataceae bacterium]|jgi:type 1 glutamine amidotransferase|nr:ThuA domain-containing protein [Gemmataceae bacterium]